MRHDVGYLCCLSQERRQCESLKTWDEREVETPTSFFSIYPIFINRLFWGVLQGIYFLLLWQRTRTKNSSLAEISSRKQEKVFCLFWAL